MNKFLCSICIIFNVCTVLAQKAVPRIEYLSMEDGMSQVSVNDMVMDDKGFVWIGTADGLNRYDGNIFKTFLHDSNDSLSISGNYITKIETYSDGKLLVGTRDKGLNLYDSHQNTFRSIKFGITDQQVTVSGLAKDHQNGIWVATLNHGLFYWEDLVGPPVNYRSNSAITGIFKDNTKMLWVGHLDGTIQGFFEDFEHPKVQFKILGNVQSFFKTADNLFVGGYDGFYAYEFETGKVKSIELENSGAFKTMHVLDFLKEDDRHVWIATGRGLYLYDFIDLKVKDKIEYKEEAGLGLSNNTVQALLRVSPTQLFVGTANELNCIEFKPSVFQNISKNKKGQRLLNDNVIFSVYKDKNGLWVGTSDGGLNLITNDGVYYYVDNQNESNSIAGSVVRAIVYDKINNRIWFATTRGLSLLDMNNFDPQHLKFKNFYHDPNNTNSINANFLKDLVLDGNNVLWGATHEHGIFRMEYHPNGSYNIARYKHDADKSNTLTSNETNCLELDKNGNIWVGTQNGVSRISFKSNNYNQIQFKNFRKEDYTKGSLAHNAVNDILVDDNARVWMGTRKGLSLLNSDGDFTSWSKQDQFPNTLIYSLQDDLRGNLWIGTNDGLVKFDPVTQKFAHFSTFDNIQGREFDTHARYREDDGTIYMGGVEGLTYFNPNSIATLDAPQQLYFLQLSIREEVIESSHGQRTLEASIEATAKINIQNNQFPFYLKFSALDFRLDKNIKYAYRLTPLDNEWNFINDNTIQFLNLPRGTFDLEINGFSRGTVWNKPPLQLKIKVYPPWWSSNLAILSYIGLLIALTYWFYNFQLSRKLALAESKKLKEIDQLKNSLYTNITHEFRTPITVIQGMAETLEENQSKSSDTAKSLHLIKENSSSLLKMVNDMLDLTKLESAEIDVDLVQMEVVNYIQYIFESFESMAKEKQIDYVFYSEINQLYIDVDAEKLATIVKNLIVNAIKFTEDRGKIICHLKTEDKTLMIKIIDDGIGIPKADLPNVFEKFYQVKNYTSPQFKGTGIGLALTKELVKLMGGQIKVNSEEGKGSEFTVTLPISNQAHISTKKVEVHAESSASLAKATIADDQNVPIPIDEKSAIALIIEDNKDVAYYLKTCLEKDYKILLAEDGEKGIEIAKTYIPDIIISDVMMPKKNGFEVCATLKTELVTNHIPIILLTAKASDKDRIEGLTHGADAYLVKPFNKKELFARIGQLIQLRKTMIEKFSQEDFRAFIERKDKEPQTLFIQQVVKLVNTSLDDSDFDSAKLAEKMHLSESQLYRKIKATTNRSTAVFIRSIRLNKAKILLQTSDKTISEIAYEVGFKDPSWFSRAFKKEFGKSPTEIQ
ncbi:response regulator [Hyunsoonleella sp. SJ7]|uniref:histidine kinase n=1 Tax=Hyunsoonleella aquatilis TaxID=2762758 RepID=A0A923KG01_9FLAO|nr:hybrid sensor histidine kinase/response regulator transcription factor [Hyunsoonleella aquatilis]MBC3757221.1 response regulator [Hyunsoonleella aquatilis]